MRMLRTVVDAWIGARPLPDPLAINPLTGLRAAVVVTGGSEGIGREIAHRFARDGHHVVIVGRNDGKLNEAVRALRGIAVKHAVTSFAVDITEPDAPERIEAALRDDGLCCEILVNCAGVGLSGPFHCQRSPRQLTWTVLLSAKRRCRNAHDARASACDVRAGVAVAFFNVASFAGLVPGPVSGSLLRLAKRTLSR